MILRCSLLGLLALSPAAALADTGDTGGDPCLDWGQITPSERTTYVGEFVTFRVRGAAGCGRDATTCAWWADRNPNTEEAYGDFLESTGSPVTYRAPTELEDCITTTYSVWVACTDGNTTNSAQVTVKCTHEQLQAVQDNRSATLTGGGCSGPPSGTGTAAGLLLVVPGLSLLRRKRRD